MTPLEWSILAISVVNLGLALAVGVIYWKNHHAIRSSFTWALLLFATFLVLHNAFQIYELFTMMGYGSFPVELLAIEGVLLTATSVALLLAASR